MSSVFGLNANPQIAKVRPLRSSPKRSTHCSRSSPFCPALISSTASRMAEFAPTSFIVRASALTSFGRQDPPYPTPGKRNVGPILRSEPTPRRTMSTSAPVSSQSPGDRIHEADPGREHRVGRVLGDFGGCRVHHQNLVARAHKGSVEVAERLGGHLVVHAQYHAVRPPEVSQRCSLLEKFGIGADANRVVRLGFDRLPHKPGSPHWNRALGDDDALAISSLDRCPWAAATTWLRSADPSSSGGVPTAMKMM